MSEFNDEGLDDLDQAGWAALLSGVPAVAEPAPPPAATRETRERQTVASPGEIITSPARKAPEQADLEARPAAPVEGGADLAADRAARIAAYAASAAAAGARYTDPAPPPSGAKHLVKSLAAAAGASLRSVASAAAGSNPSGPRRPRRHGKVGIGRLLCWQLAAVAVIASLGAPRGVLVAVAAGAVGVVAATTVRIRGRLVYQWMDRARRFALRPHRARLSGGAAGETAAENLVELLGDHARVESVDLDGIPVAFIHQSSGVSAVLELHASVDSTDPAWASLLSVAPLLPAPDAALPPFGAQLIMQTTPPSDLRSLNGDNSRPARRSWITVQAVRTADIHEGRELTMALSNAVQRMMRRLGRDDIPTRTLDQHETLTLIEALAQLDTASERGPVEVEERWTSWEVGATRQACFRLIGWQEADDAARQLVLRRLELIPSRGTTMAIAAGRRERHHVGEVDCAVTVRITERDRPRLENSASLLAFALEDVEGVRPERLDGDHLAALAASLPLGARAPIR